MDRKKGFTLIELMVAMGIIAILVTMSVIGISIVQRSLRNTQRRDALNSLNLAINTYFSDNGVFPDPSEIVFNPTGNPPSVTMGIETVELKGHLVPVDFSVGTTNAGTVYCYESDGSTYALGVGLEGGGELQLGTSGYTCAVK